jgi:NAD(P)-dependent dehydrogenase (short-subunit alcohol dehydrogenase family)
MASKNYPEVPGQEQKRQPGLETEMTPAPRFSQPERKGSGRLKDKIAIITGGDSGIGRSVAVLFAREGAKLGIVYLDEDEDAQKTQELVEAEGSQCLLFKGDVGEERFCQSVVDKVVEEFGGLNILVNNAAEQHVRESLTDISQEQLERTFHTNIFAYFYMAKAALPHLKAGDTIINTTSVTAFRGKPELIDYSATKGAIVAFTRSLAQNLGEKEIRVNAVAPGPIWTPLIPATFPEDQVAEFGKNTILGRPGQPEEVAPSYVFLACSDSSYITGQTLHPNGGEIVGG